MIPEFFVNIIFNIVVHLLSALPEITVDFAAIDTSVFMGVVRCVLYMLPLGTVNTILSIIVAVTAFRIAISIVKTIWDLIPLV